MRAIVSKQKDDGSYTEAGMLWRTVIGPYKRQSYIDKMARRYGGWRTVRVELFNHDLHQEKPDKVYELEALQ